MKLKRKTIEIINKTQNWFCKNIDTIAKSLASLIWKKKRGKTQNYKYQK